MPLADQATITVVVRDAEGNTIPGSIVVLEASGSGNSITQPVGVTGSDGIATGTIRSTIGETKTIGARIDGSLITDDVDVVYVAGTADYFWTVSPIFRSRMIFRVSAIFWVMTEHVDVPLDRRPSFAYIS